MGMTARAHLAYGYNLGDGEDFKAAERDEYGAPKLAWLPTDEDGDCDYSEFADRVEERLLAATGFVEIPWGRRQHYDEAAKTAYYAAKREAQKQHGVELDFSGHGDYAGWVLIVKGSGRSVEWSEVMALDLDELSGLPTREGWNTKLSGALATLGITPTQDGPKWLVYPSYG